MSSKRATIAAVKSLKSISKVCSSGPRNNLRSLKNLSTAAERLDPASANGYQSENLLASCQNPDGLGSNYQNPRDFEQGLNPIGGFEKHPAGQNGNFSGYSGQNVGGFESGPGYREGYRGDYQNRRAGDAANFQGSWEQNSSGLQQSPGGFEQKPSGFQQNQSGMSSGRFGTGFQQGGFDANGYANGYQSRVSNGATRNGFHPGSGSVSGNANSYQNQNWQSQQHTDTAYRQSMQYPSDNYSQGYNETSPNPKSFDPQGLPSNMQGLAGGNHPQNHARPQENAGQNMWNSGNFQKEPSASQQSSYGGQNQMYQNNAQTGQIGSLAVSNSQPIEESCGTPESTGCAGSIEEFDVFCKEGKVKDAVGVLPLLENNRITVDLPRYVQLMQLCGDNKAIEEAKAVHEHITRCISPVNVYIFNRILDMYLKCNAVGEAFAVFDKMAERNLTTWDTMITGLANNCLGEEAIDIFTKFKEAGLKPDGQMFIPVFSACGVVGDACEGMLHFNSMAKDYGITPSMEHYVSVVDMLGRIGHLHEALEFTEKMPLQPGVKVWETLMNLCRIHGERELGDRCAELVELLDPSRLNEQSRSGLVPVNAAEMAKEEEKKKAAKKNLLEARSTVHEYRAGDTSHPETDRIYAQLRGLRGLMKEAGYVPETRFVLHDIDQESKEDALLAHSERLAVSYGLLNSPARSSIRVIKNLRVCGDCHNALKIMSKIVGREFVMRDAKRFHHFKDGVCSCRDYW